MQNLCRQVVSSLVRHARAPSFPTKPFYEDQCAGYRLLQTSSRLEQIILRPGLNAAAQVQTCHQLARSGSQSLLKPQTCSRIQAMTFKVKMALKRRCPQCYFVQRGDRLFVQCHAKPRHKQMQKISKRKLFRED